MMPLGVEHYARAGYDYDIIPVVLLALMPLGVEHSCARTNAACFAMVLLALMPLGVEHPGREPSSSRPKRVLLALMPLGVEHARSGRATHRLRHRSCSP